MAQLRNKSDTSDMPGARSDETVRVSDATTGVDSVVAKQARLSAALADPLAGMSIAQLRDDGYRIAVEVLGVPDAREFQIGAILAKDPKGRSAFDLSDDERQALDQEEQNRWKGVSRNLVIVVGICSLCAAVQGMDETVINGAQVFFAKQFGIEDQPWILGLVNSAPYLCCAFAGCWLAIPLNHYFGRRNTIWIACCIDAICCILQGVCQTWQQIFAVRLILGLGIGTKSATVPLYAAECAPTAIRGALTMMWQVFTAFGIMIGYASDLAFYNVRDTKHITGLNWRLMMGSACIFAIVVCCCIWNCPESPRYLMDRAGRLEAQGKPEKAAAAKLAAWESMLKLRRNSLQAARDMYLMVKLSEIEKEVNSQRGGFFNCFRELFTVGRNRRAMIASEICMFMQQFCGVNVIAYYSTQIFLEAAFSMKAALLASFGFGMINFVFALPAVITIDTFGRRSLLLTTFPLMALCLLFTGLSFLIPATSTAHIACIATGIYLFGVVYSPGAGPVPFTYSAEAYPLYIRTHGMALATATTWFFNFLLSITWPALLKAFSPTGAFCYYSGWNVVGNIGVLLFVPETKGRTLEKLEQVFGIPIRETMRFGIRQASWFWTKVVTLGKSPVPEPVFLEKPGVEGTEMTPTSSQGSNSRGMVREQRNGV